MNKTVKNSAIYFLGTVATGILGFVNTMLLTRILSQQVYAMYGLFNTFATAAIMFISFGYDSSYMRFYYDHGTTQKKYLFECLKAPIVVFVVFLVALLEPSRTLISYIFESKLSYLALSVIAVYFMSSMAHRFIQLTARMEEMAWNYTLSNIVGKSGFIIVLIALCFANRDITFYDVLMSFLVASVASVIINLLVFRKIPQGAIEKKQDVNQKALFTYGFPFMINNVLILVIPVIEKVIIRDLAGWEILSIFTAASVFQTVVSLLTNTVNNIWNPIVFKSYDDEKHFKPILHHFGMAITVISAVGLVACVLLRRWLVLLLDSDYFAVYIIAPAICFAACFSLIITIYSVGINIKKKTVHFVVEPIIQIIVSVALCYLLIPSLKLIGIGIAILSSIVLSRLYRMVVGLRLYSSGTSEWKSVLLCVVCTAVSVLSMFLTTLKHDIILAICLVLFTLIIMNKDIAVICKTFLSLVSSKKTNSVKEGENG